MNSADWSKLQANGSAQQKSIDFSQWNTYIVTAKSNRSDWKCYICLVKFCECSIYLYHFGKRYKVHKLCGELRSDAQIFRVHLKTDG